MRGRQASFWGVALLALTGSTISVVAQDAVSDLDWQRMPGAAQDVSVSHQGQRWMVGLEGRAYRWDVASQSWQSHGRRSDLARIDAGAAGVAALTANGQLLVRKADAPPAAPWRVTSLRARDLGLGNGLLWLSGARINGGPQAVRFAPFNANGLMNWQEVEGAVDSLDVDPGGRPWASDGRAVYVYADEEWILDPDAPAARDIGVGGDGTIYAVAASDGSIERRNPATGTWEPQPGRVSAISAGPDGKAMGADPDGWILAAVQDIEGGEDFFAQAGPETDLNRFEIGQKVTLADLIGNLPGAARVQVTIEAVEFNEEGTDASLLANASIYGVSTKIVLYQPDLNSPEVLVLLRQDGVDLANYVPGLSASSLGSFGMAESLLFFPIGEGAALSWAGYEDVPDTIKRLLPGSEETPVPDLFPLEIGGDVTVVGLYSPPQPEGGSGKVNIFRQNAARVAGVLGLETKTYLAKGSFTRDQLARISWSDVSPEFAPSNKSTADWCAEAAKVDLSGLDLSVNLGNWTPDFGEGLVSFRQPTLSLRSVDGKVEPSVSAGIDLFLPEAQAGLGALNMAGRLAVQTPPETLCGAALSEADLQIAFAGVSTLGRGESDLASLSFATLSSLTGDSAERPALADRSAGVGWQDAFGLPFLDVVQYASSGVFNQSEGARGIDGQLWLDVTLGAAPIDVLGTVELTVEDTALAMETWSLSTEGPVVMGDLPGLDQVPGMDSLLLADLSISPDLIEGTATFQDSSTPSDGESREPDTEMRARVIFGDEAPDGTQPVQAYLRIEDYSPERSARFMASTEVLPDAVGDWRFAPAIVGVNTGESVEASLADGDDWLWVGMLEAGESLEVLPGLTLAGKADPQSALPPELRQHLSSVLDLGTEATFYTSATLAGEAESVLSLSLDQFGFRPTAGLAYGDLMSFTNASLEIDTTEGRAVSISSDVAFSLPQTIARDRADLQMSGEFTFSSTEDTRSIQLALETTSEDGLRPDGTLPAEVGALFQAPLDIADLNMTALGANWSLEEKKSRADTREERFALTGDASFRGYEGTASLELAIAPEASGSGFDGAVSFSSKDAKGVPLSALLPPRLVAAASVADASVREFILSSKAIAANMDLKLGELEISGLGAVLSDGANSALFLRQDKAVAPIDVFPKEQRPVFGPVGGLVIPGGVFVLATQEGAAFGLREMPVAIYEKVVEGYADDRVSAARLLRNDGLSFLTRMDVSTMPEETRAILSDLMGINGSFVLAGSAGGVFDAGADKTFGFALGLEGYTPPLPDLPAGFLSFDDASTQVFVQATKGAAPGLEVGIATEATLRPVRLDTLEQQELKGTFSLAYAKQGAGPVEVATGIEVAGTWVDPMGLEGYSFEDPALKIGVTSQGALLEVATKKASLRSRAGAEFAMDLATTWVGGAPTSLAGQFGRVVPAPPAPGEPVLPPQDLELNPADLMRAYHSFFDLALRTGAATTAAAEKGTKGLGDVVLVALEEQLQLALPAALTSAAGQMTVGNLRDFFAKAGQGNDAMLTLLENSPMAMIAVRNPVGYFGTPGAVPPRNSNLAPENRPPLGFGLYVGGTFVVDAGGVTSAEIADGHYRVDLSGYSFEGEMALPGLLSGTNASVNAQMPLLVPGSPAIEMAATVALPEALNPLSLLEGLPLPAEPKPEISGKLVLSGPQITEQKAQIDAQLNLLGIRPVAFSATLDRGSFPFSVPASCTMPFAIEGTVPDANDLGGWISALPSVFRPAVPDPIECLGELGDMLADLGQDVGETVVDIVEDPAEAARKGFDTAERLAENAAEIATNPAKAVNLGISLAKKPADVTRSLSNVGFGFAQAGAGKVPVVGPVAAEALGAVADTVGEVTDFAQAAVLDNAVSGWVTSSLADAGGAVAGAINTGVSTVVDWFDNDDPPTWYTVNPLRCSWERHYWNPLFSQCFENGAVVILDENLRGAASRPGQPAMGPCIAAPFQQGGQVRVTPCQGDAANQFHFDPISRQIRLVRSVYNGYNGGWPAQYAFCLTRRNQVGSASDAVVTELCGGVARSQQEWNFTDAGKLQSGSLCADNQGGLVKLASCERANRWTASALLPNWNLASDIPVLGHIRNVETDFCPHWEHPSGPWRMRACDAVAAGYDDPSIDRNALFLRLLDGSHRAEIMGPRAWDGEVHYGCMGANAANGSYLLRHCYPTVQSPDAVWVIEAVSANAGAWLVDPPSRQRPVAQVLAGTYRLRNELTGRCLAPNRSQPLNGMALVDCPPNATPTRAVWRGYIADKRGISAQVNRAAAERLAAIERAAQTAAAQARREAYPQLLAWQRARTQAENARIGAVFAEWTKATSAASSARLFRSSPAHCTRAEYWDHASNSCKQANPFATRFPITVQDEQGRAAGCLRARFPQGRIGVTLWGCDAVNAHNAIRDIMAFAFDQEGRIRIKNYGYRLARKLDASGQPYFEEERYEAFGDSCLGPTRSRLPIEGQQLVAFTSCDGRDGKVQDFHRWRMSANGELISHDGRCMRWVPDTWNDGGEPVMVLQDCKLNPMRPGVRRFTPQVSRNLGSGQNLPETARLRNASGLCLTTDLQLGTAPQMRACAGEAREYFAFGGVSQNGFLISPRNAKTCLQAAADQSLQQDVCNGALAQTFVRDGARIVSAETGLCLGQLATGTVVLLSCDAGMDLSFEEPTLALPQFASEAELQNRSTPAVDALVNAQRTRSSYMWSGAFLGQGDRFLHLGAQDAAVVLEAQAETYVKERPVYLNEAQQVVFAPGFVAPATTILTLPGFEDGAENVTFAHARDVRLNDAPTVTDVSDPYGVGVAEWMIWLHEQKVLGVQADGTLGFGYIDETPEGRRNATFRMMPARDRSIGKWSFEALGRPGQYLAVTGENLVLGTDPVATSLTYESVNKWLVSEDLSGSRGPARPKFEGWAYPKTRCSFLAHNPHKSCP